MASTTAVMTGEPEAATLRPRFWGTVRGELFKISRQRATWFMALMLTAVICFIYLVQMGNSHLATMLKIDPVNYFYRELGINLLVLRVFSGNFLLIVTARLIGMEYSGGTIRILLGRGIGRLHLLFAKLTALAFVALMVLVGGIVLNIVLQLIMTQASAGNLDGLKSLTGTFWQDAWTFITTVMVSMAVTILMAAAASVLGRSLAIGLSVAIAFFPVDNIGTLFLYLGTRLTGNNFFTLLSGNLLGPNLNVMPDLLLPQRAVQAASRAFAVPLVPVTGVHTQVIALLWGAAFAIVAIVLTWKRDVKE